MAGGVLVPPPHSTSANTHLPEIRIVVLGDGAVGKTSLLRQYLDREGPASSSAGYESTLLDSYTHIEYCGKQPYRVHFTDCSSAPEFREHRAAYLAKCDVVLLVFSALHRKTLSSLHKWMTEVVDARTSTGPARFASTAGDFSEVPVFVIGTHYGECNTAAAGEGAAAAPKLVSSSDAEAVTKDCLHSAGYFLNEDDADMEEELRSMRLAAQKERKVSKKKQSPSAFRNFFGDLFKGSVSDDDEDNSHHRHHHHSGQSNNSRSSTKPSKVKADKGIVEQKSKGEGGTPVKDPHFSPHSPATAALNHTPFASRAERPLGLTEPFAEGAILSEVSTPLALPPGASPRLPLYMLSNDDGTAVNTAVRASLALHLWLKQLDDSGDVSPGLTPLPSPRQKSAPIATGDAAGHAAGSATPAELIPFQQHARSLSAASHASHVSERSAASFIPTMHALYGSVTSLSAFDTSYHHSRATSAGLLTAGNSPLVPVQKTAAPMLVAVGDSSVLDLSSPGIGGKVSTEPYGSATNASQRKGPLDDTPWCSPTILTPGQISGMPRIVVATPTMKKVSSERSPLELDATVNDVALQPQQEERLVQANTDIFVCSPPNPRRATAPNTAIKVPPEHEQQAAGEISLSTPFGDYSALSGQVTGDRTVHPLPSWATADTPEPRRDPNRVEGLNAPHQRLWKDVGAEPHLGGSPSPRREAGGAASGAVAAAQTDSVVKKLSLEREGRSGATTPAQSPQKPPLGSAQASPASRSPRAASNASAPSASRPRLREASISTLQSPSLSPRSEEQTHTQSRSHTHTHSRSPSHASAEAVAPPTAKNRSQTRPPHREEDGLAKSASLSASGSQSRALTSPSAHQKQKTKQCTTDGCHVM